MEIRRLVEAEWEAYRTVRLEALAKNPEAFGATLAESERRPLEHWQGRLKPNPDAFLLGAWEGNQLVGIVGFRREEGPKDDHKGMLYSMYVSPDYRRGGTGRLLVSRLLEECGQIPGLVQVELMVVANNEPAIRLYESLGFIKYGLEPRSLKDGDRYLDEFLMVRFLDGYTIA